MPLEENIKIIPVSAFQDNYIWMIINTMHQCAIVVDPGDAKPVAYYLKQHDLKLSAILITHHHWDHVNGVAELVENEKVPVFGFIKSKFSELTHRVDEQDTVVVHEFFPHYQVLSIPGHTLDHLAYFNENVLFSGDTLFAGGCGRVFEGTVEQMYHSLQKISSLPDAIAIYCGHEYTLNNLLFAQLVEPNNLQLIERIEKIKKLHEKNTPTLPSTLLEEKQTNPFLRCEVAEVVRQAERYRGYALNNPIDVFAALRKWKNEVKIV